MAGTMKVEGGDELQKMIMSVGEAGQAIASLALYEGAGVMADAINASISTIRTEEFHYAAVEGVTTRLPSPEEVALVKQGGAGIAKFSKSPDEVLTSIGFKNAGYGEVNGKVKPIPLIANSINSGTSFMRKQPFFRKAVNKTKSAAQAAMVAKGQSLIDQICEGGPAWQARLIRHGN